VVVVPDRQLSLAIGKEGQNARLAAKLTGWRIDIKSESEAQAEGLDKLMSERARKTTSASEDLLTMAERILRNEDESVPSTNTGDRLWQAMQSLQDLPPITPESLEPLPSRSTGAKTSSGEGAPRREVRPKPRPVEKAEAQIASEASAELFVPSELMVPAELLPADEPIVVDWPTETVTPEIVEPAFSIEEEVVSAKIEAVPATPVEVPAAPVEVPIAPPEPITGMTELPQVITADMLRARMAKRKENEQKPEVFEIPAELLIGLEEPEPVVTEDWEVEIEDPKGKGKGKGKVKKAAPIIAKPAPKAKKKKRRPVGDDDDDYQGYF